MVGAHPYLQSFSSANSSLSYLFCKKRKERERQTVYIKKLQEENKRLEEAEQTANNRYLEIEQKLFDAQNKIIHLEELPFVIKSLKKVNNATQDKYLAVKQKLLTFLHLYPELKKSFGSFGFSEVSRVENLPNGYLEQKTKDIEYVYNCIKNDSSALQLLHALEKIQLLERSHSNLEAIPYMAKIMADYETYGLEAQAKKLDWGHSQERAKKVASIREIRQQAQQIVEQSNEARYQLAYLLSLFPALADVVETEFSQLPVLDISDLTNRDNVKDYLSKEEWATLSTCERNQLALDRYVQAHQKTKWQIGRDYELFVGYSFEQKGYTVDYFGSYMGLEDLGRDLIAKKDNLTLIIQCKYWSSHKTIHEKHIMQLYGTVVSYCLENNIDESLVKGVLITNIELSETAKKIAKHLKIEFFELFEMGNFPRIKCGQNRDSYGIETRIYHLPFDQQYDSVKITKKGEFLAFTVAEAERAGFRRAFKWHGDQSPFL